VSYAATHARAAALVARKGAAVTFTLSSPGTYDATTDTYSTPTTSTVAGHAVRVSGNPIKYQSLGLVQSEAPTLLFAPSTFGSQPSLGMTTSWGGVTYTVADVEPVEPDGNAIVCEVVVKR
jgi:hypothetical protein